MSVGVMKDYKLKQRDLRSHTHIVYCILLLKHPHFAFFFPAVHYATKE